MDTRGGGDHASLLYNLGMEYYNTAHELEGRGKIEDAFKFYREAANKFIFLCKEHEHSAEIKHY